MGMYSYTKGDYLLFIFDITMPKLVFDERKNAEKLIMENIGFSSYARIKDNCLAVKIKLDADEQYRKPLAELAVKQAQEAVELMNKYLLMQSILQEQER